MKISLEKFRFFLNVFAQNIQCEYTLEPPHNVCFVKKIGYTSANPSFSIYTSDLL